MQSGSGTEVIPSVPDPEPQSQLSCGSANIKKLVKTYIFFIALSFKLAIVYGLMFSYLFFFLILMADFGQVYKVSEPKRVIETLELFPLNSFGESESKNLRVYANECRDNMFSYTMREQMDHPPLDLCLSFM
jgi:hypothetical protein